MCVSLHAADCKSTAMFLADHGAQVVLCKGRVPICNWKDRHYTKIQIEREFKENPALNVGVVLGESSQIIDISGDTKSQDLDMIDLFDGCLPATPCFSSPRGMHLLMNFNSELGALGVPWLRYGSLEIGIGTARSPVFSLLPPSQTNGVERKWLFPLDTVGLLDLPQFVVDKIVAANEDDLCPPLCDEADYKDEAHLLYEMCVSETAESLYE